MSQVQGPVCIRSLNMRPPQVHLALDDIVVDGIVDIVDATGARVVETASHSITDLIA